MEMYLHLPNYQPASGLRSTWVAGFKIQVDINQGQALVRANKAGLVSLATQLLTLAQDDVPTRCHLHYDSYNSLEDGSLELVIEKTD